MAIIATAQAGPWSTPATWIGGVVPGAGDLAQINHAVNVTDTRVVGTSGGNGTDAITVAAGAGVILTLDSGSHLTCRGDLRVKGPASAVSVKWGVNVNGTAILDFDSTLAPASTTYKLILGDTLQARVGLRMAGTSKTNRATLSGKITGSPTKAYLQRGSSQTLTGYLDLSFATLINIGSTTQVGFDMALDAGGTCVMNEVILDAVAALPYCSVAIASGATFQLTNVTWVNAINNLSFHLLGGSPNHFMKGLSVIGGSDIYAPAGLQIGGPGANDWCYFSRVPVVTAGFWTSMQNVLIRSLDETLQAYGPITDCFYWSEGVVATIIAIVANKVDETYNRIIFASDNNSQTGRCVGLSSQVAPRKKLILRNCLMLPNAAGVNLGALVLDSTNDADTQVDVEHCTWVGQGNNSGIQVGSGGAAPAGQVASLRSNLAYRATSGTGFLFRDVAGGGSATLNALVNGLGDFNAIFNITGSPYSGSFGTAPGPNDIAGDPQFFDGARRFASWDSALGGPGTAANAIVELRKKNDATGYNAAYNLQALLQYIFDGFAPQNPAYVGSAHDGGTRGAVAGLAAPPTLSTPVITVPTAGQLVDAGVTVQWTPSS